MDTSVIDLPTPVAGRLRRPGWRDPRLLAGLAMVAASVLLGSWAVRTAQATVPVYVTRAAMVPGDRITAEDLAVVDVRLGTVNLDHYLRADAPLAADEVVVRAVGRGELVPASAVGSAEDLDLRPVSVTLERAPSGDVVPGALVDLWFTPPAPDDDGATTDPRELAAGLTVAEVTTSSGAFSASGGGAVHVLVPSALLPDVLTALAADGTVDVVPVLGTGG
ncbi:SAF domain-containing protein [uncultured Cellulomonas sp.]|uniref:SAF domain-containing protein n=1 Tax=uncultured Cellulomonas sp. TaxID=189682 RepID=UPI0028E353F3|nr:SAF domain-containing protein [uncultured Cellulomonas sp.]